MKAKGDGNRVLRAQERVREEISALLAREVKDPAAASAVVSRVEMSPDLRHAKVFVRALGASSEDVMKALGRAAGFLRGEVARRVGLRHAPELRFVYDEGIEAHGRVDALLAEIERERRGGS